MQHAADLDHPEVDEKPSRASRLPICSLPNYIYPKLGAADDSSPDFHGGRSLREVTKRHS